MTFWWLPNYVCVYPPNVYSSWALMGMTIWVVMLVLILNIKMINTQLKYRNRKRTNQYTRLSCNKNIMDKQEGWYTPQYTFPPLICCTSHITTCLTYTFVVYYVYSYDHVRPLRLPLGLPSGFPLGLPLNASSSYLVSQTSLISTLLHSAQLGLLVALEMWAAWQSIRVISTSRRGATGALVMVTRC